MTLTHVYVDPSLNSDTGLGTLGSPYGDLEYCIREATFDAVNGTQINVKSGVAEVLSNDLAAAMNDTGSTPAWVPVLYAPVVIRGYTTVANDGGKAEIDGAGAHGLMGVENRNYIHCIDLYVHNTGGEIAIKIAAGGSVMRCEVSDCSVNGIQTTNYGVIYGCYVHNVSGNGISMSGTGASAWYNRVEEGPDYVMDVGIFGFGSAISRNTVKLNANTSSDGIITTSGPVVNNSVYCPSGGTGIGIRVSSGSRLGSALNNLVEGFSGVGGSGYEAISTLGLTQLMGGNGVFNCTNDFLYATPVIEDIGGNEVLTESPFRDPDNGDFYPVAAAGSIREGSLPLIIGGL